MADLNMFGSVVDSPGSGVHGKHMCSVVAHQKATLTVLNVKQ